MDTLVRGYDGWRGGAHFGWNLVAAGHDDWMPRGAAGRAAGGAAVVRRDFQEREGAGREQSRARYESGQGQGERGEARGPSAAGAAGRGTGPGRTGSDAGEVRAARAAARQRAFGDRVARLTRLVYTIWLRLGSR